jgi:hypothetical protein
MAPFGGQWDRACSSRSIAWRAALIAAVIVPGYLYSQAHGFRAVATPTFPAGNENALEIIHRDHAVFAPAKVVGRDLNVGKSAPH